MLLYKYCRDNDKFRNNLRQQQLWFNRPADFNDFKDSNLLHDWALTDEDILNELEFVIEQTYKAAAFARDFSSAPVDAENLLRLQFRAALADRGPTGMPDQGGYLRRQTEQALEFRRNSIGITCFTENNLSELMWAHYAESHTGVCICVETDYDKRCFRQLERVSYESPLPKFKLLSHMRRNLIRLYTTKGAQWAYEREIRAFQHASGAYKMNKQCLVSVFFGMRSSPAAIEEIRDIVRRVYGREVRLFRMSTDDQHELSCKALDD
jgi:hypothetical protein